MTEPTDSVPVKSEETAKLSFPLALLRLSLGMARADLANDQREGLNPSPELERIPQIEYAIRALESRSTHTLVPNELWAEIKGVLGEYGREGNWNRPIGYILDHKFAFGYYSEDGHVLDGFLPAQLVLAKMEAEKK